MPLESATAFVLGTHIFNEQDKIVHLLTSGEGIIKVVAPGSSKGKNRFGSLLELFTEGEFFFYRKEDRELSTLSRGEIITSYFETVSDPGRIFFFYLISEILLKLVPSNIDTERIYNLVRSILRFSSEGRGMVGLTLYFMVWVMRIEGMMFDPGICSICKGTGKNGVWVMKDYKGAVCGKCRTDEEAYLDSAGIEFIEWTKNNAPGTAGSLPGGDSVKLLFQLLKKMTEHHGEFSLNSARYLKELG